MRLCSSCFVQLAIQAWQNFRLRVADTELTVLDYEVDEDRGNVQFSYLARSTSNPDTVKVTDNPTVCAACTGPIDGLIVGATIDTAPQSAVTY